MFEIGQRRVSAVSKIKRHGRRVALDDGTRWDVLTDSCVVEMWEESDKVVVIDDVMYNLEDAEHAYVDEKF